MPSRTQPASSRKPICAPALTSAWTPGEPSAFITTTDQSPSRTSQVSVCVPAPCTEASQMCCFAGRRAVAAGALAVVGMERASVDVLDDRVVDAAQVGGHVARAGDADEHGACRRSPTSRRTLP